MKIAYMCGIAAITIAACAAVEGAVGTPLTIGPGNVGLDGSGKPDLQDQLATDHEVATYTNVVTPFGTTLRGRSLNTSIGGHRWGGTDGAFASQTAVDNAIDPVTGLKRYAPGAKIGYPDNGAIASTVGGHTWNYQLGIQEDSAQGATRAFGNALYVGVVPAATGPTVVASKTYNLLPGEQGKYGAFNMLFMSKRADQPTAAFFSAAIKAVYDVGGVQTEEIVWSRSGTYGNQPGGSFGSAGVIDPADTAAGPQGGWHYGSAWHADDNDPAFEPGFRMTASYQARPGEGYNVVGVPASLWTFSAPIALDDSKKLVGLTFEVGSNRQFYQNELWVMGISAVPAVPEPAALSLLGLGALGLLRMRRA